MNEQQSRVAFPRSLAVASTTAAPITVRSTLECGGSTPPFHDLEDETLDYPPRPHAEKESKGSVEPPHSKVLRT
jgi:hypothetical protein